MLGRTEMYFLLTNPHFICLYHILIVWRLRRLMFLIFSHNNLNFRHKKQLWWRGINVNKRLINGGWWVGGEYLVYMWYQMLIDMLGYKIKRYIGKNKQTNKNNMLPATHVDKKEVSETLLAADLIGYPIACHTPFLEGRKGRWLFPPADRRQISPTPATIILSSD